jgi:hypothetical protein
MLLLAWKHRGKDLALAHRDGGVAPHQGHKEIGLQRAGHREARRLDAQRHRRHVDQDGVDLFAGDDAGLHRRAQRHGCVRVDLQVRLLPHAPGDQVEDGRNARRAADQQDAVDVAGSQPRIFQRLIDRQDRALQQIVDQADELGAFDLAADVQRLALAGFGDVLQAQRGEGRGGEGNFRLFRALQQPRPGAVVGAQVDLVLPLKLVGDKIGQPLVEVVAAEKVVARRRHHIDHAGVEFDDRHVEGAAAQVVDKHATVRIVVDAVAIGQRRGGGFIDDPLHRQASNGAGFQRGLALHFVEVSGHCDDGTRHRLAQRTLGGRLNRAQDEGRDFLRRVRSCPPSSRFRRCPFCA